MGQRLVILNSTPFIQTDDQLDTNAIYYHWSAYTDSAVVEITNLRDKVKDYYDSLKEHPDNFLLSICKQSRYLQPSLSICRFWYCTTI